VWPQSAIDYARETGESDDDESDDADRWLWVPCEGSRAGYHDMVQFIGTIDEPARANRLEIAIQGRGAFRRFKDELARGLASSTGGTGMPTTGNADGAAHGSRKRATPGTAH
jgi:hypothetical protein